MAFVCEAMVHSELGDQLRRAREAKDLSLDEAEKATGIRKRFLQAMEEGRFDVLPGEIQLRGFLRTMPLCRPERRRDDCALRAPDSLGADGGRAPVRLAARRWRCVQPRRKLPSRNRPPLNPHACHAACRLKPNLQPQSSAQPSSRRVAQPAPPNPSARTAASAGELSRLPGVADARSGLIAMRRSW